MEIVTCGVLVIILNSVQFTNSNANVSHGYNYEKMHRFGAGRRIIPNYRRLNPSSNFGYGDSAHPAPLPEPKKPYVKEPWHTIFQGKRRPGDFRAYSRRFEYEPNYERSQRYYADIRIECSISFLVVRTEGGVPLLLRGGVGYNHVTVVARAYVGNKLNGSVAAYCARNNQDKALRRYQYGILNRDGKEVTD